MQYTHTSDMTDSEMRKEIYKLRRELKSESQKIKELAKYDELIPLTGVESLRDFERELRKGTSVREQTRKDLQKTLRKIRYLNDLKTTHVEGAVEGGKRFEPIRQSLSKLTEEQRKEFWDMYKNLYKEGTSYERFKYDVYETLDRAYSRSIDIEDMFNLSPGDIMGIIVQMRKDLLKESGGKLSDEKIEAKFVEKLHELFS